ncbi:response regulator [Cyanobium sp. Morenito 9A2]|uniref:response regulator n=1 Tax=Cyanobium sp. Morenito 9A2 TaxID=2823718 RepID=UPI0020CDEE8C|nr:response regulator [Cyanobium sp. Morenito 9A2]MCP9849922.1 response regulator [Cyanobium sp. Morenito 9A2]
MRGDATSSAPSDRSADPLADLRHDLCTPINQILGFSELLEEELLEAQQPQYIDDLRKIQRAAGTMLALVRGRLTTALWQSSATSPAGVSAMPLGSRGAAMGAALPTTAILGCVDGPDPALEPRSLRPGRILVVDDDPLNLDLLAQRLSRSGHLVTTAVDGEAALALAHQQPFDLVLLDVLMPNLDGYGTLGELKADENLRHLPVIMISALDELSSVVRCIEAGAEDYLPKPFNPTLLRARIGACLEKKAFRDQEAELYRNLVASQQRLARELSAADHFVEALAVEEREAPQLAPLLAAFQRMSVAVSRQESALRATIEELEIQINRQVLSRQVGSILADPSFSALNERARAMRERRRHGRNDP